MTANIRTPFIYLNEGHRTWSLREEYVAVDWEYGRDRMHFETRVRIFHGSFTSEEDVSEFCLMPQHWSMV